MSNAVVAVTCAERGGAATPAAPHTAGPPTGGSAAQNAATPAKDGVCATMNVDDVMTQAANQYSAGFAKPALKLVTMALSCKHDIRMYRSAAVYACASHDLAAARQYYDFVPAQYQGAIIQRCQQEGLSLQP